MIDHHEALFSGRVLDPQKFFEAVKTFDGIRKESHQIVKTVKADSTATADLECALDGLRRAYHISHIAVTGTLSSDLAVRFDSLCPPVDDSTGPLTLRSACGVALAFLSAVVESDGFVASSVMAGRATKEALTEGHQMALPSGDTSGTYL